MDILISQRQQIHTIDDEIHALQTRIEELKLLRHDIVSVKTSVFSID